MGRHTVPLAAVFALFSLGAVAASTAGGPMAAAATTASTLPPTTTTLPARSPTVDMANPVAVGLATMRAYWGYNTVTDTSTWAAVLRSTAYYTPRFAEVTRAVHPSPLVNDPQWDTWAAHHAKMAVNVKQVFDGTPPPSTPTKTYVEYLGVLTPHGEHHWTGKSQTHVAWMTLVRANTAKGTPWLVARLVVQ